MSPSAIDRWANRLFGGLAFISGGMALLIIVWIGLEAFPAFRFPGLHRLITDSNWLPGSDRSPQFGIAPLLAGSVMVMITSMIPAAAIGLSTAVFQVYYSPRWFSVTVRKALELLAGIPSVVIGFWGLIVIVPIVQKWQPPGQNLLTAGLVLGLMILPTVALTASSALSHLPKELHQSAAALGMGRARTVWHIYLPVARRGITAGIILAAARAIGETMAVIMVCGNIAQWPSSLFEPFRPVTSAIALEMGYASEAHRSVLFATAFALVVLVAVAAGAIAFSGERRVK